MFDRRITIFTGHFGSGKTEVAVNYTLQLAKIHERTVLVDLDVVNPFFRSTDVRSIFEDLGLSVICPVYANSNVDVPSLPAEIIRVFQDKSLRVVLDVGGDDMGAKVLSRYRDEILEDDYELYLVVNPHRIMTDTPEKIGVMIGEIEESARLKVTALVNNGNLMGETRAEDILADHAVVLEAAARLGLPVAFAGALSSLAGQVEEKLACPVLPMEKHIRPPWDI